ncbi:PepSY domain-containing protein [Streptococcus hongkongensis]|nr:hypothetical protein NC01_03755 [Streptococcus uberis]
MTLKKLSIFAIASLSLLSLGACGMDKEQQGTTQNQSTGQMAKTKKAKISEEKAKSIAIKDASVTESDTKLLTIKKENDDGKLVYDVEFNHGDKEYSYIIDANSGEILEKSSEPIND